MRRISAIIPARNEGKELTEVLSHLFDSVRGEDFECILVNDGSVYPCGKFRPMTADHPQMKVINTPVARGVGFSFDRGVEAASGDIIVIMGADVYPKAGWHEKVQKAVTDYPNSIGCAVSIGIPKGTPRYGADLLITLSVDDLPANSVLRKDPNYTDIFKGRWKTEKESDEPYEIPCLMGAFYFTTKDFYTRIVGFDTLPKELYRGHRVWGSLEPFLSLKAWLSGGSVILHPDIEAEHVFGRVTRENRFSKGARSADNMWWNSTWIAETMVHDPVQRKAILDYPFRELNLNKALQMIKRNYNQVEEVRELNRGRFTRDLQWFMDKFGYKLRAKPSPKNH